MDNSTSCLVLIGLLFISVGYNLGLHTELKQSKEDKYLTEEGLRVCQQNIETIERTLLLSK